MTFWQDARPATPRFRRRRPHRERRPRRPGSRASRRNLVVAVVIVRRRRLVAIVRSGGDADADSGTDAPRRAVRPHRAATGPGAPARWARPLPDWPRAAAARRRRRRRGRRPPRPGLPGRGREAAAWSTEVPTSARSAADVARATRSCSRPRTSFAGARPRHRGGAVDAPVRPSRPARSRSSAAGRAARSRSVSTTDGGLVGLDDRTGQARWSVRLSRATCMASIAVDPGPGSSPPSGSTRRRRRGAAGRSTARPARSGGSRRSRRWPAPRWSPATRSWSAPATGPTRATCSAFALARRHAALDDAVAAPFQPDLVPLVGR